MTLTGSSATEPGDLQPGVAATARGGTDGDAVAAVPVRLGPAAAGRCRRRVHLDADPTAARSLRAPADDGLRLRLADGVVHREEVLAALRAALGGVPSGRELQGPDDDRARAGGAVWDIGSGDRPPVIFEPSLRSDSRFGSPDLLLWAGDGYRPVLIRSHRTTDPGSGAITSTFDRPLEIAPDARRKPRAHPADTLALAHHYRLLADLGLAGAVAVGGVIGRGDGIAGKPDRDGIDAGGDDRGTILWHQLDVPGSSVLADYDVRFADRLAVAAAAANRRPPLAVASRIGECRRCSWWPLCSAELLARQDISLVAAGGDVDVLHAAGVQTVDDLARMDADVVAAMPLTGGVPGTARVRARAWLAGRPLVRMNDEVRVRRADLELDVDMESFLEDGAYLWGTYLSGPATTVLGLSDGYRAFVSWRPLPDADEGRSFVEFWTYLTGLRALAAANGLTFAAYCYSRSAEERWLRSTPARYPGVPGMPSVQEISEFCSSADWVDIYQEIRDQFIVPGSMKLKSLAPLTGFAWRDPEPGGENSMAWYRQAVGLGSAPDRPSMSAGRGSGRGPRQGRGGVDGTEPTAPVDPAMAGRILQYNEDDVLATLALRRWMTDRAGEVPTAAELDAN